MLYNKIHKGKGFTMIELLVVLLIIGILAAVAAPMYLAHTEKAKASEAVGVMSLIRSAEREYRTVHGNYLAVSGTTLANDPGNTSAPGLGINLGPAQYFSIESYGVTLGSADMGEGTLSADFTILADGHLSANITAAGVGARNYGDVAAYQVKMDNSGHIIYSTGSGAAGTWKSYKG